MANFLRLAVHQTPHVDIRNPYAGPSVTDGADTALLTAIILCKEAREFYDRISREWGERSRSAAEDADRGLSYADG